MRRRIVAFTVAALLTGAAGVSAQIYAPQTLERYFRLEWDVTRGRKGPVVEGYVYNTGWVPMAGRAYFRASVSDAARYRVQVLSFDWARSGGGGGGGG